MDNQGFTNEMLLDILHDFPTDAKVYIREEMEECVTVEYCIKEVGIITKPNGEKRIVLTIEA